MRLMRRCTIYAAFPMFFGTVLVNRAEAQNTVSEPTLPVSDGRVARYCEHATLEPDVLLRSGHVLPVLTNGKSNPTDSVQQRCCGHTEPAVT